MERFYGVGSNCPEKYISILEKIKTVYPEESKISLFYQVGDFYELYGIEYENGEREGNIWEFGRDLGLSIVLKNTVVKGNSKNKLYFGGVQIVSLDKYLSMAVNDYGWTIVIYSQAKDDITGKLSRKFDTIISPGTNTLTTSESNNLVVIYLEDVPSLIHKNTTTLYAGVSYIDTVSGESGIIQYPFKEHMNRSIIFDELIKIITIKNPNDIIIYGDKLPYTEKELIDKLHIRYYNYKIHLNKTTKDITKRAYQENLFSQIYKLPNSRVMTSLNIDNFYYCGIVLTIMVEYVMKRNKSLLEKIKPPRLMTNTSSNLILANNSLEQLNIVNNIKKNYYFQKKNSLLEILDNTKTLIGKRLFRSRLMNPITDIGELNARYNTIDNYNYMDTDFKNIVGRNIKDVVDIQNVLCKLRRGTFKYVDILPLYNSLSIILNLLNLISKTKLKSIIPKDLVKSKFESIEALQKLLDTTFNLDYLSNTQIYNFEIDKSIFNFNVNQKLDSLQIFIDTDRNLIDELIKFLTEMVDRDFYYKQKKLREKMSNGNSKGKEISKTQDTHLINKGKNALYDHYIFTTPSRVDTIKKTLNKPGFKMSMGQYNLSNDDFRFQLISKGKMRIDLDCIHSSSNNLIKNIDELRKLSKTYFIEAIGGIFEKYASVLEDVIDFIGELDFIQSCSNTALEFGYVRPTINDSGVDSGGGGENPSYLKVKGIRHPIIEQLNQNIPYVSNDVELGTHNKNGILLFGVNAVGKSSLMKSIGCNIIMAQAGMFVPSSEFIYKPFKYLFTRICGNDNIFAGMSTFEVEMEEFKIIMNYADSNSIILGDEICSGTETLDATAIVASGINILSKRKANFLFATHLHYLAKSSYISKLDNICCKHMSVIFDKSNNKLLYERKLQDGSGPSSYGIEVCKSMNMDDEFMEMSQQIRDELDTNSQMILGKKSKYNKDKIIGKCEVCGQLAVDTHHIKYQCSADENGMIDHWHKDNKFNLVGLCKECHQSVHSSPPRLEVEGYQQTSHGIELIYKYLNVDVGVGVGVGVDEDSNNSEISSKHTYEDELKDCLSKYTGQNLTLKQIQHRLKKQDNITITQKDLALIL